MIGGGGVEGQVLSNGERFGDACMTNMAVNPEEHHYLKDHGT